MKRSIYKACLAVAAFTLCACAQKDDSIERWQALQADIRNESIARDKASAELADLTAKLKALALKRHAFKEEKWAYPLKGYSWSYIEKRDFFPNAVYGPYKTRGYDFFDGNRHGGHPAHDIFIMDKNQDSRDDVTKKMVNVASMTDALVISTCYEWMKGSKLRGGKYVWTYNPAEDKFFYYAHMKNVLVQPGQLVRKGDILGTVGRTGLLAAMKRSPSHIHLMVLEYKNGKMLPYDYYKKIKR